MNRTILQQIQAVGLATRRAGSENLLGALRSRRKGQGLEYAESRAYEPGDDVRHIDWKVTARTGRTHTKLYEEEKRVHAVVAIDTSGSMYFGCHNRTKIETATTLAAMLAFSGFRAHDEVEIWLFDSEVHTRWKPAPHRRALWALVEELERWEIWQAQRATTGPAKLEPLAAELRARRRMPQMMIVLSDFGAQDLLETKHNSLQVLTDMVAVQVVSTLEQDPPHTWRPALVDTETGDRVARLHTIPVDRIWHQKPWVITDQDDLLVQARELLKHTAGVRR